MTGNFSATYAILAVFISTYLLGSAVVQAHNSCPQLQDDFNTFPNARNWDVKRLGSSVNYQLEQTIVREGAKALAIQVSGHDELDKEGNLKHELWEAPSNWCEFGHEVWYSFSFTIKGKGKPAGSTRWVIGQWKEQSGGSPFLAQRFDNGVFHITVQHNDTRQLVAKASGSFERDFSLFVNELKQLMLLERQGLRQQHDAITEADDAVSAKLSLTQLKQAIEKQDISKFPFLADPQEYKQDAEIKIHLSADPDLPDPTKGWVDMRYRIKGGLNNTGLIEIWANDKFIARITGSIGNKIKSGNLQYFKMGHYRDYDYDSFQSTLFFDRFRRGLSKEDVN
ncbi:heparin lyase I family protein [Polycladidibacter stylochi]|uniref:heparin lyase I family protein n=1 Tax=Polycladidibacter stylochi TaxID=1807766 RepID=UPI00082A5583|nr:heparin lyase I family protein [Pseudovibrio stylochi]